MSAPTCSSHFQSPLHHESDDGARRLPAQVGNPAPGPHGDAGNAAAVVGRLIDLAAQARSWQHTLMSASTEVEALTGLFASETDVPAIGAAPGPAIRAVGSKQVRAALTALPADAGTVTWLRVVADAGERPAPLADGDDPVAGPLLARADPVRVLICTPDIGAARAPGGPLAGSLRVARSSAALHGIRGDLIVATRADAIAVTSGPDGAWCADAMAGAAANALVRALVSALWDGALTPATAAGIEDVARDPVKREILRLLEAGAKDEVIARKLGVSLRTCRRHIAELLTAANAVSRFQAASLLARAGLLSAAR